MNKKPDYLNLVTADYMAVKSAPKISSAEAFTYMVFKQGVAGCFGTLMVGGSSITSGIALLATGFVIEKIARAAQDIRKESSKVLEHTIDLSSRFTTGGLMGGFGMLCLSPIGKIVVQNGLDSFVYGPASLWLKNAPAIVTGMSLLAGVSAVVSKLYANHLNRNASSPLDSSPGEGPQRGIRGPGSDKIRYAPQIA